ncbi:hypothetical protein QTP70_014426, partial [Hemibagrus guttatus]
RIPVRICTILSFQHYLGDKFLN